MAIIYTCPECGADLQDIVMTSYPPREAKRCMKCGWEYVYNDGDEQIVRVPFVAPQKRTPTVTTPVITMTPCGDNVDPCLNCSNHPSNGGSGICSCTVPYFTRGTQYHIDCGG